MKGLVLTNVDAGYGDKVVVKGATLNVKPKEILVLMGPSGCGKSTLLLSILGIIKPFTGKILLNDKDITFDDIETRNIGYLPQDYGLFPHFNVIDNVGYGLRMRKVQKNEREQIAKEMLAFVELQGYEKRFIHELSGGERQRVGLARALAIKPNLLLLDEPLSNIDQITKFDVATELKEILKKLETPTIIVSHNPEEAFFLAKELVMMIDGKIEQIGTVKEIIRKPKNEVVKKLLSTFSQKSNF